MDKQKWRSTTVCAVRKNGEVAMAADGQVTLGDTVMKGNAKKFAVFTTTAFLSDLPEVLLTHSTYLINLKAK